MSASEKLKALDGRRHELANVHAEIVAVVEAAERIAPWVVEERFLSEDELRFNSALAALDEALS